MNADKIREALLNVVRSAFPELTHQTHLPMKCKILAVDGARYSVDVQPLHPDGEIDDERQPIRDVALEMGWPGAGSRGVYHLPAVSSICRVAFYGGSSAHPYVEGIVPDGWATKAVLPGEYLVQHSKAVSIRVLPSGEIRITSDQPISVTSSSHIDVDAPVVSLAGGGPAIGRVGDQVQVSGVMLGGATVIGKILSGSPKVNSG